MLSPTALSAKSRRITLEYGLITRLIAYVFAAASAFGVGSRAL
jgi:hypothetical protein